MFMHTYMCCLFFMRYFCSFRSIWHWMLGLCLIHCTISTHNFWIHAINILFETSTMMSASTRINTHATNYTWPTLSQTLPLPNMLPTMNACVCQKLDVFRISIKWIPCRCMYHQFGSALTCNVSMSTSSLLFFCRVQCFSLAVCNVRLIAAIWSIWFRMSDNFHWNHH